MKGARLGTLLAGIAVVAVSCGGAAAPTATRAPTAPTPTTAAGAPTATPRAVAVTPTRALAATPTLGAAAQAPSGKVTLLHGTVDLGGHDMRLTGTVSVLGLYMTSYDPLVLASSDPLKPNNMLATNWSITPDGKGWVFDIRRGVKFHNGKELTAQDVAFSANWFVKVDGGYAVGMRRVMDRAEVNDTYQATLWTKEPFPAFMGDYLGSGPPYLLIHNKEFIESKGDAVVRTAGGSIGTGPFVWKTKKPDELFEFEAFTGYWGKVPSVKQIAMQVVDDPQTGMAMLKTGEADIGGVAGGTLLEARRQPNWALKSYTGSFNVWIPFRDTDNKASPLSDIRVRKALIHAVNRQQIIDVAYVGAGTPFTSVCYLDSVGYEKTDTDKMYPYDPAKAKALLAEAGYAKGFKLGNMLHTPGSAVVTYMQAVQSFWKEAGVDVQLELADTGTWLRRLQNDQAKPVFYWLTRWGPECTRLMEWFTFINRTPTQYPQAPVADEAMYKLYLDASKSLDVKVRHEAMARINRYILENALILPIAHTDTVYALGPRIAAWEPPSPHLPVYQGLNTIRLR